MESDKLNIIDFFFDKENGSFSLTMNIWILILVLALYFTVNYLIKWYKKSATVERNIQPIKLKYKIGGAEVEYEIIRNYQNIEIAHKIYIELITRKTAIEIEEGKDVIVEVYNSWYSLFQITREELKSFDGVLLKDNNTSTQLVKLLTDILNKGLRPHLTEYQAKFRKWYSEQLEVNKSLSPQQIQTKYEEIEPLMKSMKDVNRTLIEYSEQLKKIIDGK
jgi:hypothetical protein